MYQGQLQWRPVIVLCTLSLTWGANMAFMKLGTIQITPLFMAGLRSLIAAICLYVWMKVKGVKLFPSRAALYHGIVIGLLFGLEFGCIYPGLEYTTASRAVVLLYTAPFFVAIGAHLFLANDRLTVWKMAGLIVAFIGVLTLFMGGMGAWSMEKLPGDALALLAGALWGATTVYMKKYLTERTNAPQTLFYQLAFSAPLLFILSFLLEDHYIIGFSPLTAFAVFFQSVIVAFISYLVWFQLIHKYPVSLLHAFSNFTPVFGVLLSGVIILGEYISVSLIVALVLVTMGTALINHRPQPKTVAQAFRRS